MAGKGDSLAPFPAWRGSPASVILAQEAGELALNDHFVRVVNLGIISRIGRIEPDLAVLPAQIFERRFLVADQGDDYLPIARGIGAAHQGKIAVQNASLDHRIAGDFQRIMFSSTQQCGRHWKRRLSL